MAKWRRSPLWVDPHITGEESWGGGGRGLLPWLPGVIQVTGTLGGGKRRREGCIRSVLLLLASHDIPIRDALNKVWIWLPVSCFFIFFFKSNWMDNGERQWCSPAQPVQPEPLMTHLAENHEANCQTEKQGRNGENGVPTVYAAFLLAPHHQLMQTFKRSISYQHAVALQFFLLRQHFIMS